MPETTQNYANHIRNHSPFRYFLFPALTINLGWAIWRLVQSPSWENAVQLLLAAGLIGLMFLTRVYPLKVQDRVIRLEERLRYQRLLPPDVGVQAGELPLSFIVALRFAVDEELPGLVREALSGKFAKADEIKRAIKQWRPDHLRV